MKFSLAIVDDDADLIEGVKNFFTAREVDCTGFLESKRFVDYLDRFKSNDAPFDLVLTDLRMPGLNGMEVSRAVKALFKDLPVIMVSGDSSMDAVQGAMDAGVSDYMVKPVHFGQLNLQVERLLRKGLSKARPTQERSAEKPLIIKSPPMLALMDQLKRVAPSDATVLVTGETGTGKEVFAKLIHQLSPRCEGPFVAVNCSAIPENLLESELFGHVKGAFTGAEFSRKGLFQEANGGTLFLDEIGEMPLSLQAKLLRVLEERGVRRVGENKTTTLDVRVVTATLVDLEEAVENKRFRPDLFHRIDVINLEIPPLRERVEDILPLAESFLKQATLSQRKKGLRFSEEAQAWMRLAPWNGNVRELENAVLRGVLLAQSELIDVTDLRPPRRARRSDALKQAVFTSSKSLRDAELQHIRDALAECGGVKEKAAKLLGVSRKTIFRKLKAAEKNSAAS